MGRVRDAELLADEEWMLTAACRGVDPDTFYPTPSDDVRADQAKRICSVCTHRPRCLEYALHYRIDHGIWGGMDEKERRAFVRRRRLDQR